MILAASLLVAVAAGFFGGWLALWHLRDKSEAELRAAVEELIAELTAAAAEAGERMAKERKELEELLGQLLSISPQKQEIKAEAPSERELGSVDPGSQFQFVLQDQIEKPTFTGTHVAAESASALGLEAETLALAEQGHDAAYIAQTLGIGRGEVELILRLSKR